MADNKDAAKEEARRKIAERRAKRVGAAASAGGGPRAKRPARSQGDYLKQTSKPPSKLGKFIKVMLILITFVGVPAMIAASFFVKVGWLDSTHPTPERTIFNQFMAVVFPKKPAEPREDGGLVKKVTEPNPNIVEFRHLAAAMKNKQMELNGYRAILEKHDPATDWDKDELTDLLDKLEKARKEVIKMQEDLGRLSAWLIKFNEAKGRARDLFDKFQEFEKKKNAALIGVAHAGVNIPGEYAEEIQDPDVKQFVTICVLELEMHKYTDEVIQDASFTEVQRNAGSMMKGVNGMIGSLPSRDMIADGQLGGRRAAPPPTPKPEPKPEPAPKPKPAPAPKPAGPAAVAKVLHPWSSAQPGMWVRNKIDRNGDITYEDTIVRSVSAEGVVLYGLKTDGEEVVQVPESTLTFVEGQVQAFPDQEIEVAGTTRLCSVIKVGDRTTWVVKDGLGAGRVPAKVDQGGREIPVTKLEAASLKLKGEDRECVHYVLGGDMIWALAGVPGYVVKRVGLFDSREVVDWGADPDARPDFPKPPKPVAAAPAPKPKPAPAPKPAPKPEPAPKPAPEPAPAPKPAPEPEPAPKPAPAPKPPEKTPAQIIEEAKALVSKGVAAFKIVLVAMREPELPSEAEKLQALLAKSQEAATLLGQAREVYVSVQEKAPDPAGVGVTVGKLEKVLQTLKTYEEAIKSKM